MADGHRGTGNTSRIVVGIAVAIGFVLGGWFAGQAVEEKQIKDVVAEHFDETRDDLIDICDDKANAAKPECATIPPPPEAIVDEPVPEPVSKGPTDAQVADAVRVMLPAALVAECGGTSCKGDRGRRGRAATDAQVERIAQALLPGIQAAFCAANGDCQGPQGEVGPAGTDAPTITDIICTGTPPATFTFRFSDGSETVVQCQASAPDTDQD